MASRLIERLQRDIDACRDPVQRLCLQAELAGALARMGLADEAKAVLAPVRAANTSRLRAGGLKGWVAWVDGLIDHFDSLGGEAALKFERAVLLAQAADEPLVQALALAWRATGRFNASELEPMVTELAEAIRLAPPGHHGVRARIGMVLADAYRYAGHNARALLWYGRARQAAGQEGDSAMMSIFLHNSAAMRSSGIMLDDAFNRADQADARQALMEVDSIANYDGTAGLQGLDTMVPLLRAQLLVVLQQFDEAVKIYTTLLRQARRQGMDHRSARFLADMTWCHARLGRMDAARRGLALTQQNLPGLQDADDVAAVHARLSHSCTLLGLSTQAASHWGSAQSALNEHETEQARWREALEAAFAHLA